MFKTLLQTTFLGLLFLTSFGQDEPVSKQKQWTERAGILVAGTMSQLYHTQDQMVRLPPKNPVWNWQAGLAIELFNSKRFAARVDLLFANKGGKELFSGNGIDIQSEVNLSYGQLSLFPIIVKPFGQKVLNPYVALGGYAAHLIKANYSLESTNLPRITDQQAIQNTVKIDYGPVGSFGIDFKVGALEYRYEVGIPYILDQKLTSSHIRNQSQSIVLILFL